MRRGTDSGRPRAALSAAWLLSVLALASASLGLAPRPARAEYRAYELDVTDVLDCKLNKRDKCRTARVITSFSPDVYQQTNGGEGRIGVQELATWMCYGDTSEYREVCSRPPARNGKFNPGDEVRITLKKHITEGWRGKVEIAYYREDLGSNVYGVRFADRQNAYLSYFERDLQLIAAAPAQPQPPAAAPASQGVESPSGIVPALAPSTAPAAPAAAGVNPTPPGASPAAAGTQPSPAVAPAAPSAPTVPGAPGAPAVTAPTPPAGPRTEPPR